MWRRSFLAPVSAAFRPPSPGKISYSSRGGIGENGLRTPSNSKDIMPDGWTRITLPPNMQQAHHLTTRVKIQTSKRREMQKCWLSQANLIGRDHGAVKDYWIPGGAKFRVSIWCPEDNFTLRGTFMADVPTSEIYLFVFKPAVEFVGDYPVIEFPHVRDALYWSFDPRGRTRLTSEMAERIGVFRMFSLNRG
ncbi:hypothetical protein B0H14DRAFT_1616350 [Mycena olivaceomarginata]|nr:hypothetical protein B0H14DRAFT_1616350 [Mycena olivaceomarginata]